MITQSFGYFSFPGLSKIPVIGELFFAKTSLPAFVAILIAILAWFVIYKHVLAYGYVLWGTSTSGRYIGN